MTRASLFIDGENFLHKVKEVLGEKEHSWDLALMDISGLIENALQNLRIDRKVFYSSRLHEHKETLKKSRELILFQRRLKTNLEKHGFEFILAGNVRAQKLTINGKTKILFREKGVDVKIAVDMVSQAADGELTTAVLCSSDSDLQPAVQELKRRKVKVVYLGFETEPNRGLMYTCDRTILLRDVEVLKACPKRTFKKK